MSKMGDEQLFYLQSRGISEEEAMAMIVNGFIEPLTKATPMEYAVELNRLIQLQREAQWASSLGGANPVVLPDLRLAIMP